MKGRKRKMIRWIGEVLESRSRGEEGATGFFKGALLLGFAREVGRKRERENW